MIAYPETNPPDSPRDPGRVREMFGKISGPYDCINRLFSCWIDLWWRHCLVSDVRRTRPDLVLDLATGSGDVALLLERKGMKTVGLDFCLPMLEQSRRKGFSRLAAGDALKMPFSENTFDAVTIAFGFRNFADYPGGLREIRRVLKPGGRLFILEFTDPAAWFRPVYYFYLSRIMPVLAGWISRNGAAYNYLASSVQKFPTARTLGIQMESEGYQDVGWRKLAPGIVAVHSAAKT